MIMIFAKVRLKTETAKLLNVFSKRGDKILLSSTLSCLEYNPRHDFLILLMRMLDIIAYVMRFAIGGAIETVALATGDVDSIGETVFAQGIGEIPEGFGMTGLYII